MAIVAIDSTISWERFYIRTRRVIFHLPHAARPGPTRSPNSIYISAARRSAKESARVIGPATADDLAHTLSASHACAIGTINKRRTQTQADARHYDDMHHHTRARASVRYAQRAAARQRRSDRPPAERHHRIKVDRRRAK